MTRKHWLQGYCLAAIILTFFSGNIIAERVFIVSGFEPFHGDTVNPSWEAVQLLPDKIGDVKLIKLKLRVSYKEGFLPLKEAIKHYKPIGILATGVADITGYHVEQVAYNQDDDIWADNDGVIRRAWPSIPAPSIIQNGPNTLSAVYFPVDKIVYNLNAKGFPTTKSSNPYRFLCNHVFYLMLYELSQSASKIPAGLIHVPPLTQYSSAQDTIVLEAAINTMLDNKANA